MKQRESILDEVFSIPKDVLGIDDSDEKSEVWLRISRQFGQKLWETVKAEEKLVLDFRIFQIIFDELEHHKNYKMYQVPVLLFCLDFLSIQ